MAATLFYIRQMLETIQNDQLSYIITGFLLSSEDDDEQIGTELLPRDIIISKLNGLSEGAVAGSLNLLQSLLARHSQYSVYHLIEMLPYMKS